VLSGGATVGSVRVAALGAHLLGVGGSVVSIGAGDKGSAQLLVCGDRVLPGVIDVIGRGTV
jgi:hypothetical protein